ncbi:hypothetical protein [Hymenobacter wooponensis]|uniref:Uncharacterized protein n=1 Tax=Hymenobacter wooponensis TaxID=1525360 RepID=A0A4Z0MM22_9BACT|nr:hypothetical protein [Hymenobacter wooponensis]TGD80297.1 hypothetical protein EU557_10660 [Hymenobacter wooponensis]
MPALDTVTIGVQHTCSTTGGGAELRVTVRSTSSEGATSVFCSVQGADGTLQTLGSTGASATLKFGGVKDGEYTITGGDNTGLESEPRTYTVACGNVGTAESCDLSVTDLKVYQPTQAGATGSMSVQVATSAANYTVSVTRLSDNFTEQLAPIYTPGQFQAGAVPAGSYRFNFQDARGCKASVDVTINAASAPPVVVPPPPVPRWFAVGGLQPRPAYLATPVSSLHDSNFAPRIGLHVVVELRRDGQELPFARLRKTVRKEAEQVDISQALHTQLRPEARYPVGVVTHDADATLAFRARYREADQQGEGDWQEEDVVHYAVLSALPEFDPTTAYLASATTPAKPLSAFASGQAVAWNGLPLDVAVWLPTPRPATYAEFVYRDGLGRTLDVRSIELPASLPAGVTRVPLPLKPHAQASTVTFQLTDTARTSAPDELPPVRPEAHDYAIPDLNDNDYR